MSKVNLGLSSVASCLVFALVTSFNVYAADSLYIDQIGNVGVGTSVPAYKLHVEADSDAYVLVKNTSDVAAERALFTLANNGKARFIIQNGANVWSFDNAGAKFQISKVGTGVPEFEVYGNGDGVFGGDVYAKGVLLTSSRERKTDFEAVDSESVLELLDQLEVLSWRYKEDEETDRHIGPIAEDFQEVFKLGNGSHISSIDSSGIALAAIKGLHEEAQEQSAKVDALQAENQQLLATNANLEKRLQKLEKLLIPADLASAN